MKYLIGIQPTGKLHIGNYLGCLAKGLRLQSEGHDVIFLIANYHSMTTGNYTPETEKELKRLGCKNIVHQTPEYTEKFFELCCKLNTGILFRMPQYKDKKDKIEYDLGLLLYPVLMASDIIMNDPDVIIVGSDQIPHIELTNDICKRIGITKHYEYEFGDVDKIMSLQDPTIKMSKSAGEKHVLYLFDENYEYKLRKANATEEGIKNLQKIGDFFGIEKNDSNLEYKIAIAEAMKKRFMGSQVNWLNQQTLNLRLWVRVPVNPQKYPLVAQLVVRKSELPPFKRNVGGSNPSGRTTRDYRIGGYA